MEQRYCYYCMKKIEANDRFCPECGKDLQEEPPMHHLKPGTVLNGKYVIGRALGEGGFGITYIGLDKNLEIPIAVKEYFPNGFANRNHEANNTVSINSSANREEDYYGKGISRFLQEARILAKFYHEPNVVSVRDYFEANNTAYIIMEYLEGINLKDYIKKNGPVKPERMIKWIMPILMVLGKIHKQGLVHRDISPDNIMVMQDGTLKLIDFGAARDVMSQKSLSIVLKPGYAPGEQYYSKGKQGPWTDIYAICATIYKCITGTTPEESSMRVYQDNLKRPSEFGIDIPEHIEAALLKGMSVHYSDRQPDMENLIRELLGEIPVSVTKKPKPASVPEDDNRTIAADYIPNPGGGKSQPEPEDPDRTVYAGSTAEKEPKPVYGKESGSKSSLNAEKAQKQEFLNRGKKKPDNRNPEKENADQVGTEKKKPDIKKPEKQKPPVRKETPGADSGSKPAGKSKKLLLLAAAAVVVVIAVLVFGGGSKKSDLPGYTKILSDVSSFRVVSGKVSSLETGEPVMNSKGTACTIDCVAVTGSGESKIRMFYELQDDQWVCTNAIILPN